MGSGVPQDESAREHPPRAVAAPAHAAGGAAAPAAADADMGTAADKTRYFLSGASWTSSYGVQAVLVPWLVLKKLDLSSTLLGVAQASYQLPLVLLPLFGAFAEHRSHRRILLFCHVLGMAPPLALAWLFLRDMGSFGWVLAASVATGLLGAMQQPGRDAMITDIGRADVQRMVVIASGIQFCVQAVGYVVASLADMLGAPPVLGMQALLMGLGALILLRAFDFEGSGKAASVPDAPREPMSQVLRYIASDRVVLGCMALNLGIGLFYISTFQVVVPTMVRDLYQGGSALIASTLGMFLIGTAMSVIFIVQRGGIRRPGRGLMLGLLSGAAVCLGLSQSRPEYFWAFGLLNGLWGMGAGFGMTMGRTLVQERSPDGYRARIMALYQLALVGSAPLGNLAAGVLVDGVGFAATMLVPGFAMLALVAAVHAGTDIWGQASTTARRGPAPASGGATGPDA